jgi:HPt (histidine-containing phosphotransfer) domain-containing protein
MGLLRPAILNLSAALDRVGGDEELLKEVAQLYLTEYPGLVDQIRDAVASSDADALLRSAHMLKGSLGTLGAEASMKLALNLEMMGRARRLDGSGEALLQLQQALDRLKSELEAVVAATH